MLSTMTDHCYAECHILFIIMLIVFMLSVIMLCVIMLCVIMLCVIMLCVIMLSVVAPFLRSLTCCWRQKVLPTWHFLEHQNKII
jgi:hypothetical protein